MKKTNLFVIGAVALATLAAPLAASAQSWRGGDRDRDGRYERWERRADANRWDGGRYTARERYNDYRRGQRDQWRDSRRDHRYENRWNSRDYGRYGYAPGHRY